LASNRDLKSLNLAENIIESSSKPLNSISYLDKKNAPAKKLTLTDQKEFSDNMNSFIGKNPSLLHLNMDGMNLEENSLLLIIDKGISKSSCLLGFHMSNNNITPAVLLKLLSLAQ
jgi:hypothetical protein